MNKLKGQGRENNSSGTEYLVVSVTELDKMIYKALQKQSAAKPSKADPDQYVITNKEKAKSQNVLPLILNPMGKKGWRLAAVNKMECYIFKRDKFSKPLEYLVCTPPELDHKGLQYLEKKGHLKMSGYEGKVPKLEITSPKQATIQKVLPEILGDYAKDGWTLAAVSGPQLYFFTRTCP